jgi:hypothetical protein
VNCAAYRRNRSHPFCSATIPEPRMSLVGQNPRLPHRNNDGRFAFTNGLYE